MRSLVLILALSVAAPAHAEDDSLPLWIFGTILEQLRQQFAESGAELPSLPGYEPPEVLPNGDIILRRKPKPLPAPREGEIDL